MRDSAENPESLIHGSLSKEGSLVKCDDASLERKSSSIDWQGKGGEKREKAKGIRRKKRGFSTSGSKDRLSDLEI
jgi:hypothetical protein